MLGAIAGDIIGSTREMSNVKTKNFDLLPEKSSFTDDTVFTLAVAQWLMDDESHSPDTLVGFMQQLGRRYPDAGFGYRTQQWIHSDHPEPYFSARNGSAMRVSPVGLYAKTVDEAMQLAEISAAVSHNHPDGIKGAQAVALAVFTAKNHPAKSLEEMKAAIKKAVEDFSGYDLNRKIDDIRPVYQFDVSCEGSIPEAVIAYLEGENLEDAVRNAISIGGDSDTLASIAAAIYHAHTFNPSMAGYQDLFVIPKVEIIEALLPADLSDIMHRFEVVISD